jgi:hypothetical protein
MKLPVYLYPNIFQVILDLDNNNRIIQVMYQREIKLQKGLKNVVQLQFKNSDQKFLNVSSSTFVLVLYDTINQRNLVEKNVTILDDGSTYALRGLGQVIFTESDLEALDASYYTVGVKALDNTGSYQPTYANTYYGVGGTIEVRQDMYPVLQPTISVVDFQDYLNYNTQLYEYYSGNLDADPQFKSNEALHTVAIYMTNFIGTVYIQGTLENDPSTFGNYATIYTLTYDNFTGIDYRNFNGIFSKIRVKYIPAPNPISNENYLTNYAGTLDRVLYRR